MALNSQCNELTQDQTMPSIVSQDCIHEEACSFCVSLTAAEVEIRETKALLEKLLEQRRAIAAEANRNHNPLIHKVPPEIASHIFTLHVIEGIYEGSWYAVPRPLILASVCKMWRDIAFSTPQLWTTLEIHRRDQVWRFPTDLARQWVARSGSLPLNMMLSWILSSNVHPVLSEMGTTTDFINEHFSRLQNLILRVPTPVLALLKLDSHPPSNVAKFDLRIANPTPIPKDMGWNHVTNLELTSRLSAEEALKILNLCPRLVSFALEVWDNSRPVSMSPFILQDLQSLRVTFVFNSSMWLFDFLTIPAMQELTLECFDGIALPFNQLESMLARSECSLTTLILSGITTNDEGLHHLLATLPSLEHLFLRFWIPEPPPAFPVTRLSDNFFRHLTTTSATATENESGRLMRPFLPLLQTLDYSGPQSFSWNILATIYEEHSGRSSIFDLDSRQSGQPQLSQLSQRPLWDLTFTTPDPKGIEDYIDKVNLLRFFCLPSNNLELLINMDLMKASVAHHGIKPSKNASDFYCLQLY